MTFGGVIVRNTIYYCIVRCILWFLICCVNFLSVIHMNLMYLNVFMYLMFMYLNFFMYLQYMYFYVFAFFLYIYKMLYK